MERGTDDGLITLTDDQSLFESVFTVAPLVIVGTREEDGAFNLAPKHLAFPLSWVGHFGFVCTPHHGTYWNAKREGVFTVSYPSPSQIVITSLTASPRCGHDEKPILQAIPTFRASRVEGVLVADGYLYLECELDRIIDGFGDNSLIIGKIVVAHARIEALRSNERDDQDVVRDRPLLAYLCPGRYARIEASNSFPFPAGMTR